MLLLRRPTKTLVDAFLARQGRAAFSYQAVGASRQGAAPLGFVVDHNHVLLGRGREVFRLAVDALERWEMFNIGWLTLLGATAPPRVGMTVAPLVRQFGVWFLNADRVVYLVEEANRVGFAYGTLPDHAEQGEERFVVEWDERDDSVHYDVFAFSRPNQLLTRLFYPEVRRLQKRFARDSIAAMTIAATRPSR
jgi:uncharacterized protein (UPF0548 family)